MGERCSNDGSSVGKRLQVDRDEQSKESKIPGIKKEEPSDTREEEESSVWTSLKFCLRNWTTGFGRWWTMEGRGGRQGGGPVVIVPVSSSSHRGPGWCGMRHENENVRAVLREVGQCKMSGKKLEISM